MTPEPDDSSKVTCPGCGNQYTSPANHWAASSTCTYPELDDIHREIAAGVLLAGGSLHSPSRHAHLAMRSTNEEFLRWLDTEFGIHGKGKVYISEDAADAAEKMREKWDLDDPDAATVYEWTSRTNPEFDVLRARWFDTDGTRTPPRRLAPAPRTLRIWYARRGNLRREGDTWWATLYADSTYDDDFLTDLLEPYAPRITHTDAGSNRVMLRATPRFFDAIGWEPIPGCADQWPTEAQREALSTANTADECPVCGGQYESLANHWRRTSHAYPDLTAAQRAVIRGVLAVRGSIPIQEETGSGTDNYPALQVRSTDHAVLTWLADELDWLATTITELPRDETDLPDEWDGSNFKMLYQLRITAHRVFDDLRTELYVDGGKRLPDNFVERSPTSLRAMYAIAGSRRSPGNLDNQPAISISRAPAASDTVWLDLLEPFDPVIHNTDTRRIVQLKDGDAFFDYIGPAPDLLGHKWPTHGGNR